VKPRICLSLVLAVLLASGAGLSSGPVLHPAGGLVHEDPNAVPGMTVLAEIPAVPGVILDGAVDLSAQMPPVGNQGGQLSCVAWAIGYYDKTHAEWAEHGWNDSTPDHQISPSFIYNQVNSGRNQGVPMSSAQSLICEKGACMLSDMPYINYTDWPSESAYSHGILYRGLDYSALKVTTDAGINSVKNLLASGKTCVLGINVYSNFDYIYNFNYTYTVHDKYGTNRGGHAVCIVGYDDSKVTADGTGAFKLVNSWGTGWGNAGYWWMSYYAVKNTKANLSGGYVYITNDRIGYSPTALARVKLTHACRDRVRVSFGIGRSNRPLWTRLFLYGMLSSSITDRPFPNNNMVCDLSDGASYLAQSDSVFVRCEDQMQDGQTGTIDFLSAEYNSRYGTSPQTPVAIPDFYTPAYAKLVLPAAFGPQGEPAELSRTGIELFPNPAKAGRVTVKYSLPLTGPIAVTLLDVSGRAVRRLALDACSFGEGSFALAARGLNAGVYVVEFKSGAMSATRKLVIQ